jgi:dTDP-4-amino-4,6-dideoxygalactose transaminase
MIPFLDLDAINTRQRADLEAAFRRVLESSSLILGQENEGFEREFASYCGTQHAIGVANGLDALTLTLRAWNVGVGDEVIVPSNTFIATWLAVTAVGAKVVPVEPEAGSYNISGSAIEGAITERTRVVIPVHLYGHPADMDGIGRVARKYKLLVLEDAAQAHGATIGKQRVGSFGHAAAFSFYPGKNLGAMGDGGAITTSDSHLAERLKMLRNYGSRQKYFHEVTGFNSRLDEVQAAVLRAKLPWLDSDNSRRSAIANVYNSQLKNTQGLSLPITMEGCHPAWHLYVIRHKYRAKIAEELRVRGIGTGIHYPTPPHMQPAYRELGYAEGSFPISEDYHRTLLSLPMGPTMTEDEARTVATHIAEIAKSFESS